MSGILAIDPGPTQSAFVVLSGSRVVDHGIVPNERMLMIAAESLRMDLTMVIEKVEGFGMAVGAEVFETVFWSGRFVQAAYPARAERIGRKAVKLHLCGSPRAKDPNIRQALLDRYGGSAAKGTKKAPGPLYGIAKDEWAALAVGVTYLDRLV